MEIIVSLISKILSALLSHRYRGLLPKALTHCYPFGKRVALKVGVCDLINPRESHWVHVQNHIPQLSVCPPGHRALTLCLLTTPFPTSLVEKTDKGITTRKQSYRLISLMNLGANIPTEELQGWFSR